MSDRMRPIPFEKLLERIFTEYRAHGTVFGVRKIYRHTDPARKLKIFGETPETPFGPAAGPHTQLAQNIAAAYFSGSRFFELKTVQKLDGEDLPVEKPCILAEDEGYNVEWSTELTVYDAFCEYVKGWWLCKLMATELGLGSPDGFVFNMSVGYDLDGIRSSKIDGFIEGLKDASRVSAFSAPGDNTIENIWDHCRKIASDAAVSGLLTVTKPSDIEAVSPFICRSVTLSTLHGCPAEDIEKIASYLITEKHLNTFIKCNPTLLGYEKARRTLDEMGFSYVQFGRFHFDDDLQYDRAVPMLKRLQKLADDSGLEFGVKITNTFPVDIKRGELPGKEMYMSGRALYPLSLAVAGKLSEDFDGNLRISFSGGADAHNITKLFSAGIWPITFATTVLKPGGYNRIAQIAGLFEDRKIEKPDKVNVPALLKAIDEAADDPHLIKPVKNIPSKKSSKNLPLFDCFMSPCSDTCPIGQDITAYMRLVDEGRYLDALKVIAYKNPLPNITGTICAHPCMNSCMRRYYGHSVNIRAQKLKAAEAASIEYEKYLGRMKLHEIPANGIKVAVIGAGPAGIASAFFLARSGFDVTVCDKRESGGGTVAHVITKERVSRAAISQDIAFAAALGVRFVYGREIRDLDELKTEGFKYVIVCPGAGKPGTLKLAGDALTHNATEFLERVVKHDPSLDPGKNVIVIGAGNTAMDAARAAKALNGVENVYIVYRRDRRNMPADEEELCLALKDGVIFKELLSPFAFSDGKLFCKKNILGDFDETGRQVPMETDEIETIPADTVIAAVGEKIDTGLYDSLGIETDEKGCPVTDANNQSCIDRVYIAGDGLKGPSTIVEAIHDATVAADDIIARSGIRTDNNPVMREARDLIRASYSAADKESLYVEKGMLMPEDHTHCLGCDLVCENCVDVCPNRANIAIRIPDTDTPQIIHIDDMCNECGNCASFCPYSGKPYTDKLTLFGDLRSFIDSEAQGFILLDRENLTFRVRSGAEITDEEPFSEYCTLNEQVKKVICTICTDYPYLL